MTADEYSSNTPPDSGEFTVVVLHETEGALSRATTLCDRIMEQHWKDFDIHVDHWAFDQLGITEAGQQAAVQAGRADILVITAEGEGSFSTEFLQWTDTMLSLRKHREGALVGLLDPGTGVREGQLHRLALRAGMDYLNHLPNSLRHGIPDLPEWCASRAETVTSTLNEIIRSEPRPSGE